MAGGIRARVWVVQIDGSIPSAWDDSPAGRAALQRAAAQVGGGAGVLEFIDDLRAFRFVLRLSTQSHRSDDIAQASREGLQAAIAALGLVGTSVVWRTFDVIDDGK